MFFIGIKVKFNLLVGGFSLERKAFIMELKNNKDIQVKQKINGFRFFQQTLDNLDNHVNNYKELGYRKPLGASAIAVYLVLMSKADAAGLLTHDFRQKEIAEIANIPRQTCSNGMNQLLERELVRETIIGGKACYEIIGYDFLNRSREESTDKENDLNYFVVPFEIFHSGVVANLVSHKEAKALIWMIKQCNSFYRAFSQWGKDENHYLLRKVKTMKENLGKSSSFRVRKTISLLSPLFDFKPVDLKKRMPRDISNRIKKACTQVVVKKYEVYLNPACLIEKKEVDVETMKALKDAAYRLKALNVPMYSADRKGLQVSFRSMIGEVAQFINNQYDKTEFIRFSMQKVLNDTEKYILKGAKIATVGAFLNSKFQEYALKYMKKFNVADEMAWHYKQTGADYPFILKKYQKEYNNIPE